MFVKTAIFALAIGLIAPSIASADIYNPQPLGKGKFDMSLRKLIAKKLDSMPGATTGRATSGKFMPMKVTGTRSVKARRPGGPTPCFGTQVTVQFQAQPRMKINHNGKRTTVYLGGCFGTCSIFAPFGGEPQLKSIQVTGKLRAMAPGLARAK